MYDTTFFARKTINPKTGMELFIDIGPHIMFTKCFGPGPYYKLLLKECSEPETSQYFGWKDYEQKKYHMIYPWEQAVRMCFPNGIEIEEKEGNGKLIGFTIEDYVEVTDQNNP